MIDEEQLRAQLHAAADGMPEGDALAARVAARIDARERSRTVRLRAAAVVFVVVVAGAIVLPRDGRDVTPVATSPPRTLAPGWAAIADAPIEPRFQHTVVAMDRRILVFGGYAPLGRAARGAAVYDAVSGRWEEVPEPPGDHAGSIAVWAAGRVYALDKRGQLVSFDPQAEAWRSEPSSPFDASANAVTAMVWTGQEIAVVNSASDSRGAAAFNPATGAWRDLPAPSIPLAFFDLVWTGTELLAVADVGGSGTDYPHLVVLALGSADRAWRTLPQPPLVDVERRTHGFAVWTGSELLVGGGDALTADAAAVSRALVDENREPTADERAQLQPTAATDVAAWSPSTSTWRRLPNAPTPVTGLDRYAEVWTGTHALVWGANDEALLLDPSTGMWSTVGPSPAGTHQDAPAVWTGHEAVVWSGEPTDRDRDTTGCCEPSPSGFAFTPPTR